jgi:hypothetical protein
VHEEAREGHLIERRQGGEQDRDPAVVEEGAEEEVLRYDSYEQ